MSVVRSYHVLTAFELKAREPGGSRASEAIAAAQTKLQHMSETVLPSIDAGLDELVALLSGAACPTAEALHAAHGTADRLMGFCAVVAIPHLDTALLRLCQLVDAVVRSGHWSDHAFEPCLAVVRRARGGQISDQAMALVCDELDQCRERFLKFASEAAGHTIN